MGVSTDSFALEETRHFVAGDHDPNRVCGQTFELFLLAAQMNE